METSRERSSFRMSERAQRYCWRQVGIRAGVAGGESKGTGFESLELFVHYGQPDQVDLANAGRQGIVVVPCSDSAWADLLERPPHSLDWLPVDRVVPRSGHLPFDDPVPILLWGAGSENGRKPFAQILDGRLLIFYVDILASALFMLSRWEEKVVPIRDEHRRFPATASVAYRQGFIDRPIVDEYGLILREWIKALLPGWEPQPRQFIVRLSHDVDHVRCFPDWCTGVRAVGRDLLKRRDFRLAGRKGLGLLTGLLAPSLDLCFRGIRILADLSTYYGLKNDVFFFMAADPGPFDEGYDPASPWIRRCIDTLREQGFEIGLHASYGSLDNPARLREEKRCLEAILGTGEFGGRHHYLRFTPSRTWRDWEHVGLLYDSTMGYADHEGFRCGTCYPFRPFDLEEDRELGIWEHPLIVSDRTLQVYRRLSPPQAMDRIRELAHRCRLVGGVFELLWHSMSWHREWHPSSTLYKQVVRMLAQMQEM